MVNSLCFTKTGKISKEWIAKVSFYFLICKLCFVLQHLEGSNTLLKAFASNKNEQLIVSKRIICSTLVYHKSTFKTWNKEVLDLFQNRKHTMVCMEKKLNFNMSISYYICTCKQLCLIHMDAFTCSNSLTENLEVKT